MPQGLHETISRLIDARQMEQEVHSLLGQRADPHASDDRGRSASDLLYVARAEFPDQHNKNVVNGLIEHFISLGARPKNYAPEHNLHRSIQQENSIETLVAKVEGAIKLDEINTVYSAGNTPLSLLIQAKRDFTFEHQKLAIQALIDKVKCATGPSEGSNHSLESAAAVLDAVYTLEEPVPPLAEESAAAKAADHFEG